MWISRQRRLLAEFFPSATLDMNFAQSRYLGAAPADLTVTRASTAYAEDTAGVWSSFSSNVARITNNGLLVEEARTNSIRNNSMTDAVVGTPGTQPTNWSLGLGTASGLTKQVVGLGTENGVDYLDLEFSGTTSGTITEVLYFDALTNALALTTGQLCTTSVFLKLVAGSMSTLTSMGLALRENDSGPAFLRQTLTNVLTADGTLRRFSQTVTAGASTVGVSPGLRFSVGTSVAVSFTIRIGWPQIEVGAFGTSPIRTTTVAVTRAVDAVSLTSVVWLTSQAPMTLYAETNIPQTNTSIAYRAVEIDNATNTARISNSGGNWLGIYNTNGSATAGAVAANVVQKSAVAIAANDLAACMNGGTVGTDATVTALTGLNRVTFGASTLTASVLLNGYVRRVAYFPSRLANAAIQSLTT